MTYNSYFFEYSSFCSFGIFEEFANVIVFYPVTVESDIWAQKLPPPQHCHLNCDYY